MPIDHLHIAINALLDHTRLQERIQLERRISGGHERLILTRDLGDHIRYLEIAAVVSFPGATWDFTLLVGAYKHTDPRKDFDGRRGGDLTYTLTLIRRWLIELAPWDGLRSFEEQGP